MNIIIEERENIILNNDTAQNILLGILDKFDSNVRELSIHESLHGNLDFSILKTQGFNNIKSIIIAEKGEVTNISNLPEGLEKLVCSNQYLIELENIPKSIKEIDCQHNFISSLDISNLNKLKILQISNNQIKRIENIPNSLEELYCNNNRINNLNLRDLLLLRVLHTSNNKAIIIENLPPSVVDFKSENNPYIEIEYANLHRSTNNEEKDNEEKINYIESIFDYFKLKKSYEDKNSMEKKKLYRKATSKKIGKKKISKWIPKCIQCKQPGGTIFSRKNETNYAVCGNKNSPCNLNIEIFNGKNFDLDHILQTMGLEELIDVKENIIKQKLDNIFNYENEKIVMKKFKENLEEFSFFNNEYNELLEKNNNLYKDEVREDMILRKTNHIYDLMNAVKELINQYNKDNNGNLLKTAIEIQVNELNPEIQNLRRLRYEIMEIKYSKQTKSSMNENEDTEEEVTYNNSFLFQRYYSLQKLQTLTGKPPAVVKYSKSV